MNSFRLLLLPTNFTFRTIAKAILLKNPLYYGKKAEIFDSKLTV